MRKALALAALMLLAGCGVGNPTTGDKVGFVIRVAKSGVMCDTWEATLVRGGITDGTGAFGQPFDFTIEDAALVRAAQEAMDKRFEVKLSYHSEGVYSACRSDSGGHFATAIAPLQK